jgi:NhaP-type Na+/H+ or K+/H+ antiporter
LGSVLSATDPVAVVALLKELGASLAFNHLIEGYIYIIYYIEKHY